MVRMTKIDAWILAAIGYETPSSLQDVVINADFINHTIPSQAELEDALYHLGLAGLASVEGRRFCLTSEGTAWLNRFGWDSRRNATSVWIDLANAWNGQELPVKEPNADFRLEPGELESAVDQYRRLAQALLTRQKRGRKSSGDRGGRNR
jgi:hypothetical protein